MTREIVNPAEAVRAALERLRKRRPIFHSEADLQHELACELSAPGLFSRVRVELPMEGIRVDIVADNVAIELKYVPGAFSHEWEGERFSFQRSDHDRPDRARVGKDTVRLINLMESGAIAEGFVVLLTNRKRLREKMADEDWRPWHDFGGKNGDFRYMLSDVRKFCDEANAPIGD